jgi:hypothetical protein
MVPCLAPKKPPWRRKDKVMRPDRKHKSPEGAHRGASLHIGPLGVVSLWGVVEAEAGRERPPPWCV